jgi:hypothetical protein
MKRVQTQWSVFHVCGHRQAHDRTKITQRDRESRARWLATRVCTKCWKSPTPEPTAGLGVAQAAVDTRTQVRPLPPLEGTLKQVTWATSIRATLLMRLWEHRAKAAINPDEFVPRVELLSKDIRKASFWIEHCEVGLDDLEKVLHGIKGNERERS